MGVVPLCGSHLMRACGTAPLHTRVTRSLPGLRGHTCRDAPMTDSIFVHEDLRMITNTSSG
ncbi:hypothetical protein STXM2123_5033 [Streptomyces sp. F-3]|nr:hypothetical protein STXM2123_5033 [Streptomyces sp. F-3]